MLKYDSISNIILELLVIAVAILWWIVIKNLIY